MKNLDINFPLDVFEDLIINIGWESLKDWLNFWSEKDDLFLKFLSHMVQNLKMIGYGDYYFHYYQMLIELIKINQKEK